MRARGRPVFLPLSLFFFAPAIPISLSSLCGVTRNRARQSHSADRLVSLAIKCSLIRHADVTFGEITLEMSPRRDVDPPPPPYLSSRCVTFSLIILFAPISSPAIDRVVSPNADVFLRRAVFNCSLRRPETNSDSLTLIDTSR